MARTRTAASKKAAPTATLATAASSSSSPSPPPSTPSAATATAQPQMSVVAQSIAVIFNEAQKSKAGHRKLFNSLRRLHLDAVNKRKDQEFLRPLVSALNTVLATKLRGPAIERLVVFLPGFIAFSQEKDRDVARKARVATLEQSGHDPNQLDFAADDEEFNDEEDNFPSSHLAVSLINYLLHGVDAKDKNVRYRCARLIFMISSNLTTLSDNLFESMKLLLCSRTRDKEPAVRKEIVLALSNLQASDDDGAVAQKLADMLLTDPSPLVRRTALAHLTITSTNVAAVVSRCRDVDPATRRAVYKVLAVQVPDPASLGPQFLNTVLSSGLRDPDMSVRQACVDLVHMWVKGSAPQLATLLVQLNVVASPIAEDLVMECCRGTAASGPLGLTMSRDSWRNLTPETSLLLRCYTQVWLDNPAAIPKRHSEKTTAQSDNGADTTSTVVEQVAYTTVDEILVVERLAYFMQLHCNHMITNTDESLEAAYMFVVRELVKIATLADYSDPHGRTLMFNLVRNMLGARAVPEDLVGPLIELLRLLCIDERDFIRVVNEVIGDTLDSVQGFDDDEEQGLELDEEETLFREEQYLFSNLKALVILRRTLEATSLAWTSDTMVPMHGLVNELVAPAPIRFPRFGVVIANALACLGMISLTSKDHAKAAAPQLVRYTDVLNDQDRDEDDEILDVAHVAFASLLDLVLLYGVEELGLESEDVVSSLFAAIDDPVRSLGAAVIPGCVKLALAGRLVDPEFIGVLAAQALSGRWSINPEIHQCLDYFMQHFPTTHANKQIIADVFPQVLAEVVNHHNVKPVGLLPVGAKLAACLEDPEFGAELQLHVMAQLLDVANPHQVPIKPAIQICSKFTVQGGTVDSEKVKELQVMIANIPSSSLDVPANNALNRVLKTLIDVTPRGPQDDEADLSSPLAAAGKRRGVRLADDPVSTLTAGGANLPPRTPAAERLRRLGTQTPGSLLASAVANRMRALSPMSSPSDTPSKSAAPPAHSVVMDIPPSPLHRHPPKGTAGRAAAARARARRDEIEMGLEESPVQNKRRAVEKVPAEETKSGQGTRKRKKVVAPTSSDDDDDDDQAALQYEESATPVQRKSRRASRGTSLPLSADESMDLGMEITGADQFALRHLSSDKAQAAKSLAAEIDAMLDEDSDADSD
ncbi:hypothetical protein BCR44DRAFT_40470 [Catenaria anguillulae PL171]|uniref:Nuclear condensin complex subunit 3 C-terminal domain-containing protein n=1 Tax=Catenaria anguillulae PL171 TaxID=765915 RepID=A0A1Y2I043_9FUNG|nr:hypothetical protein BCR44DRAFT_40470 [Catenaria anguillulae PL171]